MDLCQSDLRCLDAHSHLGNFVFDHWPQNAIRHYEVGLRIGELSLGGDFTIGPYRLAARGEGRYAPSSGEYTYIEIEVHEVSTEIVPGEGGKK